MTGPRDISISGGDGVLDRLEGSATGLEARPATSIARILGRVGQRFLDPGDRLRKEAEERVPMEAGLSAPMAREVIRGMASDWSQDSLEELLRFEFENPAVLDRFTPFRDGTLRRAVGGRLAFHIGAGNVPGTGTTSLIRSLLVKCPVLLKPGSGDRALAELFAAGVAEGDPELATSLEVRYWAGGSHEPLEEELLARAQRIVAYGGMDFVSSIRSRLPVTTPLVAYHHRVSVGAVARECLSDGDQAGAAARSAARALALFDQRGCVSPQLIWVEEGAPITPFDWAELLAEQLEAIEEELPGGPVETALASGIQQLRGSVEMGLAMGSEGRLFVGGGLGWTVLTETSRTPFVPCLGRTARIRPVRSLNLLPELLAPFLGHGQTIAIEADPVRRRELAEALTGSGFSRISTFRKQPWPPPWWLHDGQGPLQSLVSWIQLET